MMAFKHVALERFAAASHSDGHLLLHRRFDVHVWSKTATTSGSFNRQSVPDFT